MRYGMLPLACCLGLVLGTASGTQAAATDSTTITIDAQFWYGWFGPMVQGTYEATGDIEDGGGAAGSLSVVLVQPPFGYEAFWSVWLTSSKGTLVVEISTQDNGWEVLSGSGDYAGAAGGGTYEEQWTAGPFWMVSYVTWTLSGSVDM